MRELVSPESSRRLVGPLSERVRSAFGPLSERVRTMLGARAHWHGNAKVSLGLNCVAGAALSQGPVQVSWQSQHFRKVKFSQGLNGVAGAALSKGQVKISWHAHHFRKVKCRIRGRCSTFARSSTDFVTGASLSQGQVQISWQAQHFRKVKYRFRGKRSTFARSTFTQLFEVNFRSWGLKIATFKYESSTRSPLSQPGLEHRNFQVRK